MKTRIPFRLSRIAAFALALTVVAACDDSTGPTPEPLTPESAAETMNDVVGTFVAGNDAVNSLMYYGDFVAQALGGGPIAPVELSAAAERSWPRTVMDQLAPVTTAVPANIPAELEGSAFEWDEQLGEYVLSERSGPTNGVRFFLYAVNPITGVPESPLNEIGYVDIVDTSTLTVYGVSMTAVVDNVTLFSVDAEYTYSEADSTESLAVDGFFSDGESQLNFDAEIFFSYTEFGFDFSISLGSFGASLVWTETETATTITALLTDGDNDIEFVLGLEWNTSEYVVTAGSGVYFNDELVAVMSGSFDETGFVITITNADGDPLTAAELAALEEVFDVMGELLDFFYGMIDFAAMLIFSGMVA
ncbi:MAG TPA: hypothetical protein VLC48_02680 [Gemmatimonadota bacterium]|nr:hypothetical protein [Gemmatimonadota bacterium]